VHMLSCVDWLMRYFNHILYSVLHIYIPSIKYCIYLSLSRYIQYILLIHSYMYVHSYINVFTYICPLMSAITTDSPCLPHMPYACLPNAVGISRPTYSCGPARQGERKDGWRPEGHSVIKCVLQYKSQNY